MIIWSGSLHLKFNFLLWVMFVGIGNIWVNPIPYLIGSLFPDTDIRSAPIGRIIPLWLFTTHRGVTHTLGSLFLFSFLVGLYDWKWGISFGVGYLLHLLEDSSTPMGIRWWTGHKKRAYRRQMR